MLVWLLACSDGERQSEGYFEELRLSTHRGLAPMVPPSGQTMSATLVELVCPFASETFDIHPLADGSLELRPRKATRPLDELAKLIRHEGLVSTRVDGDRLLVTLKPDAVARLLCIEDGPYRVASQTPSELMLERRGGAGVRRIHVFNVRDSEEEWRRFLAREVDIVPIVNRSQLRYLRELTTSVKLTPAPTGTSIGLILNVARVPLEIRRAIALGIHRKAVVRTLGLQESVAAASREDPAEAERLMVGSHPPKPFRIMTYDGDADMRRAALVVEENLNRLGLETSIESLDIEETLKRQESGAFEAQVFLVSYTLRDWWGFFRSGDPLNFTGYSNPEFDAAANAGDADRVRQIMDRDVLIVPFFSVPDTIASSGRLCGIEPNLVSLSWLSEVHVCAPGETE